MHDQHAVSAAHYYSFISGPSAMVHYRHQNAVQLLCARARDGTSGWERLTHHAAYQADYGAYAVLMATSQTKSLVLHRYSAVTAVALQLMPSNVLARLDQSDWVKGAWIVSETFPTCDPDGFRDRRSSSSGDEGENDEGDKRHEGREGESAVGGGDA
ncbi:protein UL145 [Panine betaherpesvirus 2]|uniref:Protein UL145 n=1 Tax=Panine betaherpesvirus 2 TaxID=188763 RepID=Q8QRX5_9BETA|nr:protein UL145 [Panine betaherpesvirus 2]AAM00762.1 protein UL145 [Panine betaherpesvirus 2]QXV67876.1 protein UL145 [Panine betaherpesvirus 2]